MGWPDLDNLQEINMFVLVWSPKVRLVDNTSVKVPCYYRILYHKVYCVFQNW